MSTMNKLDAFNKDKVKCPKCKEYYDTPTASQVSRRSAQHVAQLLLCDGCYAKLWTLKIGVNNEQT